MQRDEGMRAVPPSVLQSIGRKGISSSSLFWPRHESAEEQHNALCAMFLYQSVFDNESKQRWQPKASCVAVACKYVLVLIAMQSAESCKAPAGMSSNEPQRIS